MIIVHCREVPESGGAHKFSIYSPYVMINKTGLDMSFKSKPFLGSAKLAAGQSEYLRKSRPSITYFIIKK